MSEYLYLSLRTLEKLNTIAGLLPIVYRDTQVLSTALAALRSLQPGYCVCVCVSVSTELGI